MRACHCTDYVDANSPIYLNNLTVTVTTIQHSYRTYDTPYEFSFSLLACRSVRYQTQSLFRHHSRSHSYGSVRQVTAITKINLSIKQLRVTALRQVLQCRHLPKGGSTAVNEASFKSFSSSRVHI